MAKGFLVVSIEAMAYLSDQQTSPRILSVLVQCLSNLIDFLQEFYLCYSFIMFNLKITSQSVRKGNRIIPIKATR